MISELYTTSRKSLEVVANHSMVLTYNDGQLKRWKEYLTRAFNRITLGEVLPLANEIANHYNMRIRIVPPRRSEIVLVINALKCSIVVWFDGFSAELFIAALAITTNLLLPLLRKSWESETVPRE